MTKAKDLYRRLRSKPFPKLGKEVGDFGLYDSIAAGYAKRLENGDSLEDLPAEIIADAETLRIIAEIKAKKDRSADEREFLDYWALLEEIRVTVIESTSARRK